MSSACRWSVALLLMVVSALGLPQIDDVLVEDGFEGTLGNWSVTNGAALFTGTNFPSVGTGAARIPRTCGNPQLYLTEPLLLATAEYDTLTITFDYHSDGGDGTVRWYLQYSSDGGTNWLQLQEFNGNMSVPASYSNTMLKTSYTFSDNATFRIVGGCQTPVRNFYVDEMKIVGFPKPFPGMVIQLR